MSTADELTYDWPEDPAERIWERRKLVAELRIGQNMTYSAIAAKLTMLGEPISAQTARLDAQAAALEAATSSTREEIVGEQRILSRLLVSANLGRMLGGNKDAGKLILDTMGHTAKLFGAYAPAQVDLGVSDAEYVTEMVKLLSVIRPETLKDMINGHTAGRAAIAAGRPPIDAEVVDAPAPDRHPSPSPAQIGKAASLKVYPPGAGRGGRAHRDADHTAPPATADDIADALADETLTDPAIWADGATWADDSDPAGGQPPHTDHGGHQGDDGQAGGTVDAVSSGADDHLFDDGDGWSNIG